MMMYLDLTETALKQKDAFWTAKEIQQQPLVWEKSVTELEANKSRIDNFLQPLLARKDLRIIFTGAGTSAFIGSCILPIVAASTGLRVEAIPTTDIVSNPHEYLQADVPTLLVSFGRSGNSPESVATVDYADSIINQCYQLALTCNAEGELFKRCTGSNKLAIAMPAETNDVSFAMTSSFSSMMLSALYVFCPQQNFMQQLQQSIFASEAVISEYNEALTGVAKKQYKRVIYLGSGMFKGLAQEAALKLLELTDGAAVSSFDSPLGFRHGPKAIVNSDTLIMLFVSNNPHTRKYDLDLLAELQADSEVGQIVVISAQSAPQLAASDSLMLAGMESAQDSFLLFPYIVCAQIYAFQHALAIGNTPDNPSASGTINRVVQGVNIHVL